MPHAAERWTAEMVRALPDDGNRYELVSGELVVTPAPRQVHQAAVVELVLALAPWLKATGIGRVLASPADVALGEDEVLQPDVFVLPSGAAPVSAPWADITALLLAVEVLSPATARYDRGLKRRRYQRAGVPEYWIVDLDARLIERWRPDDERPEIAMEVLRWEPAAGGPALELDLERWFSEVWGDS
jgi:Uma2 family endonuclease